MSRATIVATALGAIVSLATSGPHRPLVVWNATASAPIGLYRVMGANVVLRGDLVLAWPPPAARHLAAARGYLPLGTPLIKYVVARAGDRVCAAGLRIAINGAEAAVRMPWDGKGHPLPAWHGCKTLKANEVFLLNGRVLHSFDGRYFGPVPRANILGKVVPLWTR